MGQSTQMGKSFGVTVNIAEYFLSILKSPSDPALSKLPPRLAALLAQMERVMDDGRKVNQIMVRGNYGTQPERYWATLPLAMIWRGATD